MEPDENAPSIFDSFEEVEPTGKTGRSHASLHRRDGLALIDVNWVDFDYMSFDERAACSAMLISIGEGMIAVNNG